MAGKHKQIVSIMVISLFLSAYFNLPLVTAIWTGYKNLEMTGDPLDQWTNGHFMKRSDDQRASENTLLEKEDTGNYSFNIPEGAIINGIIVSVEGLGGPCQIGDSVLWTIPAFIGFILSIVLPDVFAQPPRPRVARTDVDLSWDGGSTYTSQKLNSWPCGGTSDLTKHYGGLNDPWGRTWNASEFSNASFRARVEYGFSRDTGGMNIDAVFVGVSYEIDTCSYAPGSGDWVVNCSQNCFINSSVSLMQAGQIVNDIILSESGTFTVNASIINWVEIIKHDGCEIVVNSPHVLFTYTS